MTARRVHWLMLLVTVALLAIVTLMLVYRATYDNWYWQGHPARLKWCGRYYDRGQGTLAGDEVSQGRRLRQVFRAPPLIGSRVYADVTPAMLERRKGGNEPCAGALFMRVGSDRYLGYGLSGGP